MYGARSSGAAVYDRGLFYHEQLGCYAVKPLSRTAGIGKVYSMRGLQAFRLCCTQRQHQSWLPEFALQSFRVNIGLYADLYGSGAHTRTRQARLPIYTVSALTLGQSSRGLGIRFLSSPAVQVTGKAST